MKTTLLYDRWLLASLFQKSIRRGLKPGASNCAATLKSVDNSYLKRRLGVVALEDVSIANPEAVAAYFAEFDADTTITAFCSGPKNRDACDLCWIVDHDPDAEAKRFDLGWLPLPAKQAKVACMAIPLWERLLVLRSMAHADAVATLADLGLPPEQVEVLRKAKRMGLENLELAYGLLWLEVRGQVYEVEVVNLLPAPLVQGIPAWAYDMHTRPGKEAIRIWRCSIPPLMKITLAQVHGLLFTVETGVLDRIARFSFSRAIEWRAIEVSLPEGQAHELLEIARTHLPKLHQIREEVINGHIR